MGQSKNTRDKKIWVVWTVGLALVALILLGRGRPADIGLDDTAEFQYLSWRLGLAHGNGYPLTVFLGHLATWIPLGTPAWRVGLLSSVSGALAVTVTSFLTALLSPGTLGLRLLAGTLAAGVLLSSSVIQSLAALPQPPALVVGFASLVPLFLWKWERSPRTFWLALAVSALALAGAAHPSAASLILPVLLYAAAQFPSLRCHGTQSLKALGAGVLVFLVAHPGLAFLIWNRKLQSDHWYGFILRTLEWQPIRAEQTNSFFQVWLFLIGMRDSRIHFSPIPEANKLKFWELAVPLLERFLSQTGVLTLILAPVGVWALWKARRALVLYIAAIPLLGILFLNAYVSGYPKAPYYAAPSLLAIVLLGAVGFGQILCWGSAWRPKTSLVPAWLWTSGLVLALLLLERNYRMFRPEGSLAAVKKYMARDSLSVGDGNVDASAWAREIIERLPAGASLLVANWKPHYTLIYMAERMGRSDLSINRFHARKRLISLDTRQRLDEWKTRPVFVVTFQPHDPRPVCHHLSFITPNLRKVDGTHACWAFGS